MSPEHVAPHFVKEALTQRLPFGTLTHALADIWSDEYATNTELVTEKRDYQSGPDQTHFTYDQNWACISLALEKMGTFLKGANAHLLYSASPEGQVQLKRGLTADEFSQAQSKKALLGTSILCVGGVEGRVLARFGADVVNIDKNISSIPSGEKQHNLTEIPKNFDEKTAQSLAKKQFDIAMACWVFDRGSGLDHHWRPSMGPVSTDEIAIYRDYMRMMLSTVKKGGFVIANGNMLSFTVQHMPVNTIELFPTFRVDTIDTARYDSSNVWVIQK
jgi:hypothetical protein